MKPFRILILFAVGLAPAAFGQFQVRQTTNAMAEGGTAVEIAIDSGGQHFSIRPPVGYNFRVDRTNQTLLFITPDESSAITIRLTTDFPGQLPVEEILRSKVLQEHPGSSILQSSTCATGYRPGQFFDLLRTPRPDLPVRMRHVFVSCPAGAVEFTFSTQSPDFDRLRFVLSRVLSSLRVGPSQQAESKPMKPPIRNWFAARAE